MLKLTVIAVVVVTAYCSTNRSITQSEGKHPELQDSVLVDRDRNKYPVKLFPDNTLWMTANLKLKVPGSYCYENMEENCERYGRLYTWASAQDACNLLGEGWRLATKDEWERLAKLYGGVYIRDSVESGKMAYKALLTTGSSPFKALLGGGRALDGKYRRLDAHGFYWTTTEIDSSLAWFYNFGKGSQTLYQQDNGEKTDAFSVRCVKAINALK
ncbi:MAG TPA: FISUMP domain-containing protein [Flavitalea sp.]|nr:FISUMP domain-containing protein [Flavitalea sp.]